MSAEVDGQVYLTSVLEEKLARQDITREEYDRILAVNAAAAIAEACDDEGVDAKSLSDSNPIRSHHKGDSGVADDEDDDSDQWGQRRGSVRLIYRLKQPKRIANRAHI